MHRLLAQLLSATIRRLSLFERQVLRLREDQTHAIRNVHDNNTILPGFPGKTTHAQTVITRPLTEGCGLEARLVSE